MTKQTRINSHMYNLLIRKDLNHFTVSQAREIVYQSSSSEFKDRKEARMYIYRYIWLFQKKGWLISKGDGRQKIYLKSDDFLSLNLVPMSGSTTEKRKSKKIRMVQASSTESLRSRKGEYEAELSIVLGEVEEYQSLMECYPQQKDAMELLFQEAKDKSANLLGKVNALTKLITASASKRVK